ncbi:hypothetical protein [Flavobacterium sp. 3HN19-14]|uniref:hypothetical protein n=1 Tax=Flavobacterium sp. 3HN19-14 TaxID=3448133 RepID=UPI003EE255AB
MKYFLALFLFGMISCSSTDDNNPESQPEPNNPTPPVINTTDIVNINPRNATSGVEVPSSLGTYSYTEKGICWSVAENPTINDNHSVESTEIYYLNDTNTGIHISNITELTPNVKYYVRAYIKNMKVGTGTESNTFEIVYGTEKAFTTLTETSLQVGSQFAGGTIAYILQSGDYGFNSNEKHGIIAYPSNAAIYTWGCSSLYIGANADGIGAGKNNTNKITDKCGLNTAAGRCYRLADSGYNDWYLSTNADLVKIKTNLYENNVGGYTSGSYWTSTEVTATRAKCLSFGSGQTEDEKFFIYKIIPVRTF